MRTTIVAIVALSKSDRRQGEEPVDEIAVSHFWVRINMDTRPIVASPTLVGKEQEHQNTLTTQSEGRAQEQEQDQEPPNTTDAVYRL